MRKILTNTIICLVTCGVLISCATNRDSVRTVYYTQDYYTPLCEQKHHFARPRAVGNELKLIMAHYTREYGGNVLAVVKRKGIWSHYRVLQCSYWELRELKKHFVAFKIYHDRD